MHKAMLFAFAAVLWVAPALVAGMLGWPGIWGGGSAFGDLIVPAPITGGILHVPSFVAMLVLARIYPSVPDNTAAILRAGLVAAALLGIAQLIDLERLYLSLTTDMKASGFRLHQNYIGLCLLTDATIGWIWLTALRRPILAWPATLAIAVVPAALYVAVSLATSERLERDFVPGRPGYTEQRGDGIFWIYTRLAPDAPGFRAAAEAFMENMGPDQNVNVQDLAVYFTDSLHVAREFSSDGQPIMTLCLYEDGTPATWHAGRADCFSAHENFSERLERLYGELPAELPRDVQVYRVGTMICADMVVPDRYDENEATNFCRYARLDEKRANLEGVYGEQALEAMLEDE